MSRVDVLLFSTPAGGAEPFVHGALQVVFHVLRQPTDVPLLDGRVWAFVDWALPGISGLEICRRLRCDPLTAQAHVTMILDDDDPEGGRRALRAGADDYLIGPAERAALLDRVLALQAPGPDGPAHRAVAVGELAIDVRAFQARWRESPIPLMPNEFRLLRFLVEHPGRVFSRAQLIAAVGKQVPAIDERTVDVWVGRLRRALRAAGAGSPLRTVRSLGYVLDVP